MRTYVGLIRDHSGSMRSLQNGAINDYNLMIEGIKDSITGYNQDALVSVVECGVGYDGQVRIKERHENIATLRPITTYDTSGGATPLFDSVGTMVKILSEIDVKDMDKDIAFLVMVITDGRDNKNRLWNAQSISDLIKRLQGTDRWTFVFRVPVGYGKQLENLGIPAGNIMEWEQTEKGLAQSTESTRVATRSYFDARSKGVTSSNKFYTDLSNVSIAEVKKNLVDITDKVQIVWVPEKSNEAYIKDFCEDYFGDYQIGCAYYQLSKPEKVQSSKKICIKHKKSGKTYAGDDARHLLGLPYQGEVKVAPKDHGAYDVFIQSTSVNRKLVGDTRLLYFKG